MEMDKYNNRSNTLAHACTLDYFTSSTFRTLCVRLCALHSISLQLWHSPLLSHPIAINRHYTIHHLPHSVAAWIAIAITCFYTHIINRPLLKSVGVFSCARACHVCVCVRIYVMCYTPHPKSLAHSNSFVRRKVCAKHITKWFGNNHNHSSSNGNNKNNRIEGNE